MQEAADMQVEVDQVMAEAQEKAQFLVYACSGLSP